jgi:hypothetical protein
VQIEFAEFGPGPSSQLIRLGHPQPPHNVAYRDAPPCLDAPGLDVPPPYPLEFTTSHNAIFLSHRHAWQHIVRNDLPHALIVEDDMKITHPILQPLPNLPQPILPGWA